MPWAQATLIARSTDHPVVRFDMTMRGAEKQRTNDRLIQVYGLCQLLGPDRSIGRQLVQGARRGQDV